MRTDLHSFPHCCSPIIRQGDEEGGWGGGARRPISVRHKSSPHSYEAGRQHKGMYIDSP